RGIIEFRIVYRTSAQIKLAVGAPSPWKDIHDVVVIAVRIWPVADHTHLEMSSSVQQVAYSDE
ncbi:MAG TPA: hypothetical protein VNO32_52080, partial [Candidatus Acidoferrum sp.]|nr:hypothetical protein [Candidatus Acidoferrum sp.]